MGLLLVTGLPEFSSSRSIKNVPTCVKLNIRAKTILLLVCLQTFYLFTKIVEKICVNK